MIFPTTFNTLVIPTGAQPGTARIEIDSEGNLISYSDGFGTDAFFTALSGGAINLGPLNNDGSADFTDSGRIVYDNLSPAHLAFESPTDPDNNVTNVTEIDLYGATASGHGLVDIFNRGSRPVDMNLTGSLTTGNIDHGTFLVNTVANVVVETSVSFNKTFLSTPVVVLTGNNNAPAAGGATTISYAATGVTTTGFLSRINRSTAQANMEIGWIAIGA